MDVKRFEEDLMSLAERLKGDDKKTNRKLDEIKEKLVELYKKGLVKINHSALELLCAYSLLRAGYDVEVERRVAEDLVCDVYGLKGEDVLIVEIETGFVPPEHALEPLTYNRARITSKVARYSSHAAKFSLGTPPNNLLLISTVFQKPPRYRAEGEIKRLKSLCDIYYTKPPITLEQLKNARLHSIFILDLDSLVVREIDPDTYLQKAKAIPLIEPIT